MKLRNKIHLYTAVLFIGLLIFINITIYFLFKNLIVASQVAIAEQETQNTVSGISESMGTIPSDDLLRAYLPVDGKIQIVNAEGKNVTLSISPTEQTLKNQQTKFYHEEVNDQVKVEDNYYYFQSIPIIWTDGSIANLQVTNSIQSAFDQIGVLRIILFAVTLIAMIPIIVSSQLLSKIIVDPIASLTKTMKEITKSGHFKRIPVETNKKDELNEMGQTFNHMMDLLETNFTNQEQFISNASHELKTPLTIIESYASLLKRRGMDKPDIFIESVEAIYSESVRMKEMTEQLLLLAKPFEEWNLDFQPFSPKKLILSSIKSFENAYHRQIFYTEIEPIFITTDEQKLKQLVYILLENAIKYSEDVITIRSGIEKNKGFITITDQGIGIPKEEIPRVFERFYRVDKARSRKFGGTGLGLSLASEIAKAIHVSIHLESTLDIGTTVTLFLPLQEEN